MLQKRQPYQAINWSLVTLILAACGGGGGGGGAPATRAVVLPSGVRQFEVPEGRTEPTSPLQPLTPAEQSRAATDLTVKSVTVTADGLGVRIIYSSPHGDFAADARLSGPDAAFFKFDTQSESGVVFRQAPDFERPLDIGRDNHYDFKVTVSMPSNVPYTSFYNNIPGFQVKVADVTGPDDPTPPGGGPAVSATAPQQQVLPDGRAGVSLDEGQQLVSFDTAETLAVWVAADYRFTSTRIDSGGASGHYTLTLPNGRAGRLEFKLSGPDAALFEIVKVGDYGGIQFRQAPDYERPRDTNQDNQYDLTLIRSGSVYRPGDAGAVFQWQITVIDVIGLSDPTPPDQVLQGADIL